MKIYVDADACPGAVKEVICRAAERVQVQAIFVANSGIKLPRSPWLVAVRVPSGFDVADSYIAQHVEAGDLVVTADIPLAALVVPRQGVVIDPRGQVLGEHNIADRLSTRDLLDQLRGAGLVSGGPPPFGARDKQLFASSFDRELTRLLSAARRGQG